jgi:hypothetical protein
VLLAVPIDHPLELRNDITKRRIICLEEFSLDIIRGNVSVCASRDQIGYTNDLLKSYVPKMVVFLLDSVSNRTFLEWELKEQVFGYFQ